MIRRKDSKLEHRRLDSIHESVGCASTLKQLTQRTMGGVVDDHIVDEFIEECFVPDDRLKPNVAIVAKTSRDDVLDRFRTTASTKKDLFKDSTVFILSSESH